MVAIALATVSSAVVIAINEGVDAAWTLMLVAFIFCFNCSVLHWKGVSARSESSGNVGEETATDRSVGMVDAVKAKWVEIGALILVVVAAVAGVIGVVAGDWLLVGTMALIVLGQGLTFRKARTARRAKAASPAGGS